MRLRGCSSVPQCHRRQGVLWTNCHRYGVVWRVLKKIIDPFMIGLRMASANVARLVYRIPGNSDYTIDLARDLSVYCRKLKRQKMTYTVLGGQVKESGGSVFAFKTAPHCWTTNVSIRRAFNTWRRVHREVYKKTPGLKKSKWSDFKVYLDDTHRTGGTLLAQEFARESAANPGQDTEDVTLGHGEWNYSTFVQAKLIDPDEDGGLEFDDNADNWDLHIVGDHSGSGTTVTDTGQRFYTDYDSVGIIRSWYNSRNVPTSPSPSNNAPTHGGANAPGVLTDPMSNLFDVQDDDSEQTAVMMDENDDAPYQMTRIRGMENDELQLVAYTDNTAGEPDIAALPGFQAPCGLIRVSPTGNNGGVLMLDVLIEGDNI